MKDKGSSPELFVHYEIGKYVLGDGGTARWGGERWLYSHLSSRKLDNI